MASFRSRFQISRLFSPKSPLQPGSGNCGEPPPPPLPVEPCRGCPSKCLEEGYEKPIKKPKKKLQNFQKDSVEMKEKPSNCIREQEKPVEEKLTWWEQIFGPDPKRSWPDPSTCRVAHRQREKLRVKDPRLCNPRYKKTDGDVFLYTEPLKQYKRSCMEPQPKPPPAFKVPKAVLFKMMTEGSVGRMSADSIIANQRMNQCGKCTDPTSSYRLPYEEMRPLEKKRNAFSCRKGIRPQDVPRPFSTDFGLFNYRIPSIAEQAKAISNSKCAEEAAEPMFQMNDLSDFELQTEKRSRIEQLKILIQQKDTLHCIAP